MYNVVDCMKREKPNADSLITVKEAAAFLGINPETLRRWDNAGKLKTHRHPMNNYRLYRLSDLKRLKKRIEG